MRRLLGGLLVVVLALAAVAGAVLLLQSRDDAGVEKAAGPGERVEARCPAHAAAIAHDRARSRATSCADALALGNVVLRYRGTRAPGALRSLQDQLTRALRRGDRGRRPGGDPRARRSRRRRGARLGPAAIAQRSPSDPQLRAFTEAWLGEGSPKPCPPDNI